MTDQVDVRAWADVLRAKENNYVEARVFCADVPVLSTHAQGQLADKLSVGGFKINRSVLNALSEDTFKAVVKEIGAKVQSTWLVRSVAGVVVALLGEDYTIIDHSVVADAVADCGVPCIEVIPKEVTLDEAVVYFRLADDTIKYEIGDGKAAILSVSVRNSEIGVSSIGADIGLCRFYNGKPYYMWSGNRLSVDSCIRHYAKDPGEVMGVIKEILTEAPEIAQLHADMLLKFSKERWQGWSDTDLDRYPKYVVEQVETMNPQSVADVYMAICYAVRAVENAESRRRLERQALSVMTGETGRVKLTTKVVGKTLCPLCGKE